MTTRQALPNASGTLDLVWAQPNCHAGCGWHFEGHFQQPGLAQGGHAPLRPTGHALLSVVTVSAGYGQLVGRQVLGDPW